MIMCVEGSCVNNYCCVECHRLLDSCHCETAEELLYDRERILEECEYAYEE